MTREDAATRPVPSKHHAITMWDFSWLTRRHGRCAEYADPDAILDALAMRGYDAVRIDAFPHLISMLVEEPGRADSFTLLPEPLVRQWGHPEPVQTAVREPLLAFLRGCRERGLKVALSSWFNPDTERLRDRVREPEDYVRVWGNTLRSIHDAGLGDCVLYVDLCNEFPLPLWARGAYARIFSTHPANPLPLFGRWSEDTRRKLSRYMVDVPSALRGEFAHAYTFSTARLLRKEESMPLEGLDLLESHVWLSDTPRHNLASLGVVSTAQLPMGTDLHAMLARLAWPALRPLWERELSAHLDAVADLARAAGKPLWTTEGWATTAYGDSRLTRDPASWHWVKEACALGVDLALARGWTGLCTSNFSQPHFPAVWEDVEWHRSLTRRIRAAPAQARPAVRA